jgi:citronellol/citronellal dehydrogenase
VADLKGKTLFVTGASRGIGLAIAKRAARDGANIAVVAKTQEPHPKLEGTVETAAHEIEATGGRALALPCDIRFEEEVERAVAATVATFGGIDICVNNASAVSLSSVGDTTMKRFDLMQGINARGTFLVTKACLPHLRKAANPHVLMLSPPLDLEPQWFAGHAAYAIAKFGMSLCVFGFAEEFKGDGIAVNALWPRTTIATSAIRNVLGGEAVVRMSRTPDIVADAACLVFLKPSRSFTGNFLIDDSFLYEEGAVRDFVVYSVEPGVPLAPDFFVPADPPPPPGVNIAKASLDQLPALETRGKKG